MMGEVPLLVEVLMQVKLLVNVSTNMDAELHANLAYNQFIGVDELGFTVGNGAFSPVFTPANLDPLVTYSVTGAAHGEVDLATLLGVEMTLVVNGVDVSVMPGAWVWMNGAINATVDEGSPGTTAEKEACVGGSIGIGLGPGVVFGAGVDLIPIAQAAAQGCNNTVATACASPVGKAANCAVESFLPGDVNACQAPAPPRSQSQSP